MKNLPLPSFVSRASSADGELASAALALSVTPARPVAPRAPSRSRTLKPWLVAPLFALCGVTGLVGQPSAPDQGEAEETVVLSPFEVTAVDSRGYAAATTLAGNRINTSLRDVGSAVSVVTPEFLRGSVAPSAPQVPITLIRRADAVIIEFALSNSADKQDLRNKELTDSVDALAAQIKAAPGLKFENREVQLMSGNRSRSLIGKGGVVTSFANFAIFAELGDDTRLYERVKQVRALVSAAKLVGGTKVIDGPVALYLKRPNDLRKELLGKIFDDLETVKKGLGDNMEVLVTGLNAPIRLRSCSEREVELWIDYGFTIRSVYELSLRGQEFRVREREAQVRELEARKAKS